MTNNIILSCSNLTKSYHDGAMHINVLQGVEFALHAGESVAVIGPSGSGKSTLLHLLGSLDKPTSGQVLLAGQDVNTLSEAQRCRLRNQNLGFIYQFHHLLPEFSALENVAMPLLIRGESIEQAKKLAIEILEKVGLGERVSHKLSQLSGGERQRAAIARALVTRPSCVLADEPTGNLDYQTADRVFSTMMELQRQSNTALLIVTHDLSLAAKMDRVLLLEGGVLKLAPSGSQAPFSDDYPTPQNAYG